ncbi:hypothetical protein CLOBY_20360 [Clostridium saccharobutylicum]|uniref:hypothetical protein n=1 Tax=Clostridium saccharobutylicum TaxID=169679 RepID=UPI000983A444|nr:hypothetical protein [Clostridium saccharobutylicum]AQS09897.1 hypothetical protein CLOBY_20360 [Clostridium saccharobutylicum]MBC2437053.1 hypothetical protein [Clostridium saccharobutylicum]NSB89507.1 hypothetical protein [Clostridium saccharobutylicum]NYC27697.1 hypothetical protein [Clostridium saccharobutylicum]OOM12778.1 hypothetical protein CLSAB_36740 [Clostridium saccharobutylicum]
MDINKDLINKLNDLPDNIAYLAKELLGALEKGKAQSQIEELVLGEINEILREEGIS